MQYRPEPLGGRTQTPASVTPSNESQRETVPMRYDNAGPTGAAPLRSNAAVGGQPGQPGSQPMGPPMGMIAMVQQYLDQHGGQPQGGEQGPGSQDPRNGRPQQQNAPQHPAYSQPPYSQHNGGNMPHSQAGPSNYARPEGYPSQHHSNAGLPQQYNGYSSYSGQGYPSNSPSTNGQQRFADQVAPGYTIAYPSDNRASPYPSHPPNSGEYGRHDSAQPYFPQHVQQPQQQQPHARHPSQAKTSPSSSQYPHDTSRPSSSHMTNRGFQIISSASSQHQSDPSMSHSGPQSVSPPRPGFDDEGDSARASSARKRKVEGSTDREGSLGGGSKHDSDAKDANGMPTFVACTKW